MSETNSEARRILENIIEHYLRGRYSDSYYVLEAAPLEITAWRSGVNVEAKEMLWRFERALSEVEEELERRHPGVRLSVSVNPYDEPAKNPRDAQKIDTRHGRRRIVAEIERVEAEHGCTRKAAMGMLQDRKGWSIPKMKKSIEMVNREPGDGDAA